MVLNRNVLSRMDLNKCEIYEKKQQDTCMYAAKCEFEIKLLKFNSIIRCSKKGICQKKKWSTFFDTSNKINKTNMQRRS